jgi:hypothetical protein
VLALAGIAIAFFALPLVGLLWRAPWSSAWGYLTDDDALTALYLPEDREMDDVHAARDATGADVVMLALHRSDFASSGLSFLLAEPDRYDNAEYAFSVVEYGNIAGTRVVPHELGHVLGLRHPDKRGAVAGLLMGGRMPGEALTAEEVAKARRKAARLARREDDDTD